jgi:hypothetical protein
MAIVGGPVGLLLVVLWPALGWYLRRAARVVRWTFPYTLSVLWFAVRWLLWGMRVALAWLFWVIRIALRLFWG